MKNLIMCVGLCLLTSSLPAQVVTSIADGNWYDPENWDCACVPGSGSDIVVEHSLYAYQWVVVNGGSLTITGLGYLDGWSAGGVFLDCATYVFGVLDCELLQVDDAGTAPFVNHGSMECMSLVNDRAEFHNAGYMTVMDTLTLHAGMTNEPGGELTALFATGSGPLTNHGWVDIEGDPVLGRVTNTGTLAVYGVDGFQLPFVSNSGEMVLWCNNGEVVVDSLLNAGQLSTATLRITRSFSGTGDLWIMPSGDDLIVDALAHATLDEPGIIGVTEGDLLVSGLLDGGGRICVAELTTNDGTIAGTLDICDLSPTAMDWPFLDVNNGSVDNTVTFCEAISCSVSVPEAPAAGKPELFPIPAGGHVNLKGGQPGDRLVISDALGKVLLAITIVDPSSPIPLDGVPGGYYVVSLSRMGTRMTTRLIVE